MNKYKSKIQKRPLILFSGGLDSTYMLISQLAVSSVDLLIVKSSRLPSGQIAEEIARNAIIEKIKQDALSGKLKHGIINTHIVDYNVLTESSSVGDRFAQLKFWISSALEVVNPEIHSHLYLGYVSGDQITPHILDIKKAWKCLYRVSKVDKVKICFPLIYMDKRYLINQLKSTNNEEYINLIWYCETPVSIETGKGKNKHTEFKPCGICASCRRMTEATIETQPQLIKETG